MKYIYILDLYTRSGLQCFGAYSSEQTARTALWALKHDNGAIITRLQINQDYPSGIGEAKHWHIEK